MAPKRLQYKDLADMPNGVRSFLLSDELLHVDKERAMRFKLTPEEAARVEDTLMDAAFNDATLPAIIAKLKTLLVPARISEDQWSDFLIDFLKYDAWPLRELFGDELKTFLQEQNISTSGWPLPRVILEPLSYAGAASEIAGTTGLSLLVPHLHERLRDLLVSRIKGVRVEAQVHELLVREEKLGGLGLDEETAKRVVVTMKNLLANTEVISEEEYAERLRIEERKKNQPETPPPPASEDEVEMARLKAGMVSPGQAATVLDDAIEKVFGGIVDRPADEYLARRLRYLISSRLRDVRSLIELKQLLMRDAKLGGLGLTPEAAEPLSVQIENGYQTFHATIMEEEKKKLTEQLKEQKVKIEERKTQEAEEHAKWYREKVLTRKQAEEGQEKFAANVRRTLPEAFAASPLAAPPHAGLVPVPAQAAPASVPSATAPQAQASVKVSAATAVLHTAPSAKPRLDDVTYRGPRLVGPVEELRAMTLAEFRRLAKDPGVAAEKILARVQILSQESFERRMEGVRAWQSSPLQAMYMGLVTESFRSGTPIAELVDTKRRGGEEAPTSQELAAMISLNSTLHF